MKQGERGGRQEEYLKVEGGEEGWVQGTGSAMWYKSLVLLLLLLPLLAKQPHAQTANLVG